MTKKRLNKVEIQTAIQNLKNKNTLSESEKIELKDLKIKLEIENLNERKARLAAKQRKIDTHQKCLFAGEIYRLYKQRTGKDMIDLKYTDDQVKIQAEKLFKLAMETLIRNQQNQQHGQPHTNNRR